MPMASTTHLNANHFWQFPCEMPITVATLSVANHSSNSLVECQQL